MGSIWSINTFDLQWIVIVIYPTWWRVQMCKPGTIPRVARCPDAIVRLFPPHHAFARHVPATLGGYLILDHDASHANLSTQMPLYQPEWAERREKGREIVLKYMSVVCFVNFNIWRILILPSFNNSRKLGGYLCLVFDTSHANLSTQVR